MPASILNKWQLLSVGAGLVLATLLVLFPVWKDEPGGVWHRHVLTPELGRSFVLATPMPRAVVHQTRMWWDLAMVAVATLGVVWIAAPRPEDGQSILVTLRARRSSIAMVAAVCFPLPLIPAPLWVILVSLCAAGGVGSHHAGVPTGIAIPILAAVGALYTGVLYGAMTLLLRIAARWARQ